VANPLIVITGPTASGKTGKAVALARALGGEIISADSRQVYRGMDIGTGKDLDEYGEVPYHLIDICDAGYKYNLFEYVHDYGEAYADIVARGRQPILCGGTGLYLETVLKGVSLPPVPENKELRATLQDKTLEQLKAILERYKTLHNVTDFDTAKRAIRAIEIHKYYHDNPGLKVLTEPHPVEALIIGLDISREERRERITERLKARFSFGMVDEIRRLVESGVKPENLIYYGLEYKFITQYVIGEITYDEMFGGLETAIHQFAKRQMTWFRGMERRGFTIHWLPYNLADEEFVKEVKALLN
jgi:tRNA dimethylallyltransferase